MDYKRLTEESLDEIMRQIRTINGTAKQGQIEVLSKESGINDCKIEVGQIEINADLAVADRYLAAATVGKEIGIKKAPFHTRHGLNLKLARLAEKLFLRIAECENRYIREFNGLILLAVNIIKDRIQVLYRNDHILWNRINQLSKHNDKLREEINNLKASLEYANRKLEDTERENADNYLALESRLSEAVKENTENYLVLESRLSEAVKENTENYLVLENKLSGAVKENTEKHLVFDNKLDEARQISANTYHDEISKVVDEKSAILVDRINRQMIKLRDLEEKISATAAKAKWINSETYKTAENEGHDSGDVLNDPVFYHDFEERFRGTQEDIRDRLEYYLPMLLKHFGSLDDKRFVDIGCGRGEWLDMISSHGAQDYIGVDINPVQIEICKQKGHPTVMQNCMEYLADLSDESVDMISGIQIIEHLSLDDLLTLLAECRRVLRPQGMILFETPNPSNLITASNWFYIDPTHNRPIHKEFARFLAERSGYSDVEILELNEAKYAKTLVNPICFDGNQVVWDENIEILNNLLYGPQDYAIVGVKGND